MHSFISLICSYFLVLLICVQLEVKFGVIEMFLFHTQVSPFRALAVCCLFVVVLPSHGDILSGVQLVTELSNSLVPKLFQVSHRTQQQPGAQTVPGKSQNSATAWCPNCSR